MDDIQYSVKHYGPVFVPHHNPMGLLGTISGLTAKNVVEHIRNANKQDRYVTIFDDRGDRVAPRHFLEAYPDAE